MAKRLLINATNLEETRVAIAQDEKLLELDIEWADQVQLKGNIYKASISRIEPSLQAAFLDIGSDRNGFLQINDIHPAYFKNWPPEKNTGGRYHRPAIQEALDTNQTLIVQVVKDERDAKGATLTTNLSIPGRYLVLMVGNQRGGVSRKIVDAQQRKRLRQAVSSLRVPPGMGVIVRTAGINRTSIELQKDLNNLLETWNHIVETSFRPEATIALYKESDLAIRAIRDYLTADIDEILIDEQETYQRAVNFVNRVMPNFVPKLKFYKDFQPLFSRYLLDSQIEAANQPEVTLPSGGSIVINSTEAVVAIDVNSGRSTSQSDVEETAYETNKEAAEEIARQLRLRDLGGLVVIDFIDMIDRRHKQVIEKTIKEAVKIDKAKVETGRISKFGLLELSRQRLKSSLVSQSHVLCPHCNGRGKIKTAEVSALEALRKIQSSVAAGGVTGIKARMAPSAALYLLNNKRKTLYKLEESCGVEILVYADGRIKADHYELELMTSKRGAKQILTPLGTEDNNSDSDTSNKNRRSRSRNYGRPDSRYKKQKRVSVNRTRGRSNNQRNYRSRQSTSRDVRADNSQVSNKEQENNRDISNSHKNKNAPSPEESSKAPQERESERTSAV